MSSSFSSKIPGGEGSLGEKCRDVVVRLRGTSESGFCPPKGYCKKLPYRLLLKHGAFYIKLNSMASHDFVQKGLSLSPSESPSAFVGRVEAM